MYMKLEFSSKLNIIREKRRLRGEREKIERENNKNLPKQEEPVSKKNFTNKDDTKYSMEDKKILLRKLYFINNPNSQKQTQKSEIIKNEQSIPVINKIHMNTIQNDHSNCENIFIIVKELIPHAKNKFYE